eukprot:8659555-Pyramimonas_sp.AAC.1
MLFAPIHLPRLEGPTSKTIGPTMTLLGLLTPPAVKPLRREKSIRDVLLMGTHGIGQCPRARGGAMDAGRAAGDCNPEIHCLKYMGDELQGYWIHRNSIY